MIAMKTKLFYLLLIFVSSQIGNAQVVFDPATYPEESLKEGMAIVEIEGEKYLEVTLNGWDNTLNLDAFELTDEYSHFTTMAKMAEGTSGFALSDLNTFLKMATSDWKELAAAGSESSEEFKEYKVPFIEKGTIGIFQFAGQETTGWTAVVGDIMWIGQVVLKDLAAPTKPGTVTATVSGPSVTLNWGPSEDNVGVYVYHVYNGDVLIKATATTTCEITGLGNGDYKFKVAALDEAENRSYFSYVSFTITEGTALRSFRDENLLIYPSPVTSTLQINEVNDVREITILNLTGKIVKKAYNTSLIDVEELKEGIYLIQVVTPEKVYSAKFTKQ
jgi:hypothetical protein